MSPALDVGPWDAALLLGVTLQATAVAYVRAPRLKALVYAIPLPFSLANIALGEPVGVSHVVGLLNLLLYVNLVRWLRQELKLPVVLSIALSALAYALIATAVNPFLPSGELAFWVAVAAVAVTGVAAELLTGRRDEPGHRSPLPLPLKAAIIAGVIAALVALKKVFGGFMATFPMVGVVGAYEARFSLWTLARSGPAIVLGLGGMCAAMRILQGPARFPVALSVAASLPLWAAVALPLLAGRRSGAPRPD